jgi:pimeloyl-ACP methyl ester carboxylesterase
LAKGLLLAGVAVGLPALISEVIRRRAEPPQAPRWGRAHRYAGALGEVVFQELGNGAPPLVLLHSLGPGYDASQWRAAAELLADRHTVFAPDLPGWGRSEPPASGHHAEACVTTIHDFLDGVVREPAVLAAAGMSAAYAVRVALESPERVLALVLVTPLGLPTDGGAAADGAGPAFLRRLLQTPILRSTALDLLTSRSALTHHLRKEVYAAPERVDAALLDHHYRASHAPRARAALAAYLRGDLGLDVERDLEDLDVPVLLAWGRAAASSPVENSDLWLHRLPHAGLEVFAGSGELPHVESAAIFCRAVERFCDGL